MKNKVQMRKDERWKYTISANRAQTLQQSSAESKASTGMKRNRSGGALHRTECAEDIDKEQGSPAGHKAERTSGPHERSKPKESS